MPQIEIIVAADEAGAIGRDGAIPWRLREDMRRFRKLTMGHALVMGRATHESIGRTLDGRLNIVLSRDPNYEPAEGAVVVSSVSEAVSQVEAAGGETRLMVGGGQGVYEAFLPIADRLLLTRVETFVEGADTFLPDIAWEQWQLVERTVVPADDHNEYDSTYCVYDRVATARR